MKREFFKFILVGGTNTFITYILYWLLLILLPYSIAYSVSYLTGILLSYYLSSKIVFKTQLSLSSFLKFPLVYVAQYILGLGLLALVVEYYGLPEELGMVVVIIISVPVTFLLMRFLLQLK